MKFSTTLALKVLTILSWIVFFGLCIQAGGYIYNFILALMKNDQAMGSFWTNVNFAPLIISNKNYFILIVLLMCSIAVLKAGFLYTIVYMLTYKKMSLNKPFNEDIRQFTVRLTNYAFVIGVISLIAVKFAEYINGTGIEMPDFHYMNISGGDQWLLLGAVLLVFAIVFRRGIEIQTENDLTV